jgi:hypothetical protein
MADIKDILELTVLASGTLNVPVQTNSSLGVFNGSNIRIIGTATLSGNLNISPTGTPVKNTSVDISWEAAATPSVGRDVIIFGVTVPQSFLKAATLFTVNCLYNGSAWKVVINTSSDALEYIVEGMIADDAVTTAKIADDAVTLAKMAGLAKGNIIYGDASGDPASVNLGAVDANLVVGDTTNGVAVVAMSGDATIIKTGALTIANSAVTTAKIADDAVTAAKLDDDSNRTQVVIPTSFETAGEIGVLEYKICFPCTIEAIHGTVTKPFTSTGTHIFKDDTGTVLTGSQIDMSSGLFLGNIVSTTPTANNTFVAGDVIKIETSVSGAVGGRSTIVLCMLKS